MSYEILFVLAVLALALVLFVKEWFAPDGVALLILLTLVVGGAVSPREAFQSFGNEALITVAAMFILAAGLGRTGAVAILARRLLAHGAHRPVRSLLMLLVVAAVASACINNTPIVVIFLPVALGLAEAAGRPASKVLMPLAAVTIAGGMCTLIGTSTNILVSSLLPQHDLPRLSLFEPLPLAAIGTVMTIAYMMTVGQRLLPVRNPVAAGTRGGKLVEYVTELEVPATSPLVGRTLAEAVTARAPGVRVLQVIRGEGILDPRTSGLILQAGDTLIVQGDVNMLLGLQRTDGLKLASELTTREFQARGKDVTLAELLVRPASNAIGERVRDLELYRRHGIAVLAVQRHGLHLREKVADLRLRVGDILLVHAEVDTIESLRDARHFLLLEGVQERVKLPHKAWLAMCVMGAIITLAMLDLERLPISILAVAGCGVMVAGGCLSVRDAYRAVDLPLLMLIAGTICLGVAMDRSGAATWLARGITAVATPLGPIGVLSAIYLITNILTALISNNGSALLMLPIALAAAEQCGLHPEPFIIALLFAASIDFSTPIGYQVNTIVYGPGGYRFADYVKVGTPLNLLWWILATALIPVFWPLRAAG